MNDTEKSVEVINKEFPNDPPLTVEQFNGLKQMVNSIQKGIVGKTNKDIVPRDLSLITFFSVSGVPIEIGKILNNYTNLVALAVSAYYKKQGLIPELPSGVTDISNELGMGMKQCHDCPKAETCPTTYANTWAKDLSNTSEINQLMEKSQELVDSYQSIIEESLKIADREDIHTLVKSVIGGLFLIAYATGRTYKALPKSVEEI